jgi:hypothetical protein
MAKSKELKFFTSNGGAVGLSPRTARRLSYRPSHAMVPDQVDFSDFVRQRLEAELREDVVP